MTSFPTPGRHGAILLIDDDELIAGSLRHVLQADGCDVDVAVDRCSATSMMSRKSYDIVLVDPYLTGGVHRDGDLIAEIRTLQPDANVVVLTGYGSPELDRSASNGGVSAILTKPQSVVFLSQFLVAASNHGAMTPQPSIKGQPA